MQKTLIAALGLAAVSLGACTSQEPMDSRFGDATRHNKAMHVINPEPLPATTPAPMLDGKRGLLAIQRYESGTVTEPEEVSTTD